MPANLPPPKLKPPKASRLADLFWIFFVASLALDVYAISTMRESDFYAAACMGGVAMLCFMAGGGDE
jgi:hypothetical protein